MTKQKQNKAAADERNRMVDAWTRDASTAPLSDLGKQIVLRDKLRRVNFRKAIEASAEGRKGPSRQFLAIMAKHLRARYGGLGRDEVLDFIINALNPATQSAWKLEFKRRKGQPTNVGDLDLFFQYLAFREAYKVQGTKQAHKRAVDDLATKCGRTFGTMEPAVRRGRKMMGW